VNMEMYLQDGGIGNMINPAQDASDHAFSYWWRFCSSVLGPSDPGLSLICGINGGPISSSLEE